MRAGRSSSLTSMLFTYSLLFASMKTTTESWLSGLSSVCVAIGRVTGTPCWSMGAMIIMMMSSTSITSTSGVTLMSDLTPPLPPSCMAMVRSPGEAMKLTAPDDSASGARQPDSVLRGLLDEVVHELRRRIVHFDVEVVEAAGEVVVEPHRRDGDEQPECGLDERLGNTGGYRADAARTGGRDTDERIDDADDRAEQSDERRRRADGRERVDALFEV